MGSSGLGGSPGGEERGHSGLACGAGKWTGRGLSIPGGKRDEDLVLPINSSLSVTLHQDQVSTG